MIEPLKSIQADEAAVNNAIIASLQNALDALTWFQSQAEIAMTKAETDFVMARHTYVRLSDEARILRDELAMVRRQVSQITESKL